MALTPPRVAVFNIDYGLMPKPDENPRAIRGFITLEAAVVQDVNLGSELDREWLSNVQTIKIDNSDGANAVSLITSKTRDRIICPAGAIGYFPFLLGDDSIITFLRADAGLLPIFLINMPMPAFVYYAALAFVGPGTPVTPTTAVRTAAIIRTTGVSNIAAGKQKVGVAITGAANVTVQGVTLQPGDGVSFEANMNDTLGAITLDATGSEALITTLT